MKKTIWKRVSWFYYYGIFVLISKSKKGRYRYEIFGDNVICTAGYPFRTQKGAVAAARKNISECSKEQYPYHPTGDWTNEKEGF